MSHNISFCQEKPARFTHEASEPVKTSIRANGVSVPSDFPRISITINNNPDSGYIFLNNRGGPPYSMILDNNGDPVWYWKTWDRRRNIKVDDNGMLSMMIRGGYGKPEVQSHENMGYLVFDHNYTILDTLRPVNGFGTDEHDMQIFEDGSYYMLVTKDTTVDMSGIVEGGQTNVLIHESAIQGFSPEGELIFQWRPWDHFDIRDIDFYEDRLTSNSIRFPHMNAIDEDDDGHLLLSSRHLHEVTKIHRETGEIIWRLGGAHNQFTFINDPLNGFSAQHDIRSLGEGHYTLFDNGNMHNPPQTRAVEYVLDTLNMTATLIWEYLSPGANGFSYFMGNVQRLPNENTLINWAVGSQFPILTEVTPEGEVAFEMWFEQGYNVYRVYRFPWNGVALTPYLVAEPHEEAVALIFNQFGDQDVDYYRIYGGTSPNPTTLLDTSKQTLKGLTDLENPETWYFLVTSVSLAGQESEYSNEEEVYVSFNEPGQNMVLNGDFSNRKSNWRYDANGSASSNWQIEDGTCVFEISNGGNEPSEILLYQPGMELIEDEAYFFEFDAWSPESRTIEATIIEPNDDFTNYSEIGLTYLTPFTQHFSYAFTMQNPPDFDATLVFQMGGSNSDVYLDNISLTRAEFSEVREAEIQNPKYFNLLGNYPNPFNAQTTIRFETAEQSHVQINLYDLRGRFQFTVHDALIDPGLHRIQMNSAQLCSGLYVYRFLAWNLQGNLLMDQGCKTLLIK
ncbi:aryl-sulfate sulfotransferase [candidate division KSB1 bacterium]|nr:aryl-sulfate sulfotransferase [candidate division KSB1 bacterium]